MDSSPHNPAQPPRRSQPAGSSQSTPAVQSTHDGAREDPTATEELIQRAVTIAKDAGAKEVIAKRVHGLETQIRFSNSQIDIINYWEQDTLDLFLARGHRIYTITLQNPTALDLHQAIVPLVKRLLLFHRA